MIKKIQRDFLLLFQCIIDYGADVLRDFTMKKIKTKYNCDDFTVFLKDEKHCFYHQWEKNKTACCECPAHGCTLPKTGKVENTLFNKLYFFDNAIKWPKGHGKWNDSVITQKCICRYIASAITIEELDLSDLYTTLINTRIITMITNYERSLLKQIMTVRGSVCHAIKTTKFSETELTQLWEAFTDTLYKLFPGDPKWVKKGIEQLKTKILSEEDVQELMSKIGITLTEVQDISDTIINVLDIQTNAIKHCVAAEGTSIKTCINESIKPITGQLNQHSELLSDLKNHNRKREDKLNAVIGMKGKQYIRAEVYPEQLVQLQETSEASDSQKIKISIKLDLSYLTTEEEYNVTRNLPSIIEIPDDSILDPAGKETITVMATKVDSIILELKVTLGILKSVDILRLAIITLVQHVHIAAETDTNLEDTVTVNLKFESLLTKDQIAVVKCMFSKDWNDDNNDEHLSDEHSCTANVANIEFSTEPEYYSQQGSFETSQTYKQKDTQVQIKEEKPHECKKNTSSQTLPYNCRNCFEKDGIIFFLKMRRRTAKESTVFKDSFAFVSTSDDTATTTDDFETLEHIDLSFKKQIVPDWASSSDNVETDKINASKYQGLREENSKLKHVLEGLQTKNSELKLITEDLTEENSKLKHHVEGIKEENSKLKGLKEEISELKDSIMPSLEPKINIHSRSMELQPNVFQVTTGRDQTHDKSNSSCIIPEPSREYAGTSYPKAEGQKGLAVIVYRNGFYVSYLIAAGKIFFEEMGFVVQCIDEKSYYLPNRQVPAGNFYCVFLVLIGLEEIDFTNIIRRILRKPGQPLIVMTDSSLSPSIFSEITEETDTLMVMPSSPFTGGLHQKPDFKPAEHNIFDYFMKVKRINRFTDIMDILTRMNELYYYPVITIKSSLRKKFSFL